MMKVSQKIVILIVLVLIVLAFSVMVGSVFVTPREIGDILGFKLFGTALPDTVKATNVSIIWSIRIPRVLMAFIVGAELAVSGVVMQSILKNPLASSYTLGVSSGAALGAGLVIVTGFQIPFLMKLTLPFVGLMFGVCTVVFAVSFANLVDKSMENNTIILTGMIFSLFINGALTAITAFFEESVQRITYWQMGSFALQDWFNVGILFPIGLLGIIFIYRYHIELDVMTFGEEQAKTLGMDLVKIKWILLCSAAALTGTAISFVGIIGFIDLITPHVIRKFFSPTHKHVVPMSALFGGAFMVLCDLAARTLVAPSEIPIGAVTALIGGPFFVWLFLNRRKTTF